jgi:small GTP-binding protein domain
MEYGTNLRNVGIVAHVDAGKTTITENMLYLSGKIRSMGSVDKGTAHTDWLSIERERGISVRSASTSFMWNNTQINLIDTPGHVDFSAEIERSLRVLDGVVLVVSAVEGVQAQTELIWNAARKMKIPAVIFINKIDRTGSDIHRVLDDIRNLLTSMTAPIQIVCDEGTTDPRAFSIFTDGNVKDKPSHILCENQNNTKEILETARNGLVEVLAENDDGLLSKYVEGVDIDDGTLYEILIRQTRNSLVCPVLFGSAIKGIGIESLLDAIVEMLPPPTCDPEKDVSGIVFKLEHDKTMGSIAHIRLYNGIIKNRDVVFNATRETYDKVNQIRKVISPKYEDTGVLYAGDIASVCGLDSARVGDVIGSSEGLPPECRMATPLLKVQAVPENENQFPQLVSAMQELSDEDPLLDLEWIKEERELHVKIMGLIQLEVLTSIIRDRFNINVAFSKPSVIYKETPSKEGEGFVAYTMPKPCWAILRFKIEPGPRGSGLSYSAHVRDEDIFQRYQNQVEKTVPEALKQGMFGWEVTDLKVTLVEGQHHLMHTHPLDFIVATPMGIMDGLANTGTTLLEPVVSYRISVPDNIGDKVISDIVQMRGEFDTPVINKGTFTVEGTLPVSTSLEYPIRLGIVSGGRGTIATNFSGYRECPPELGATTPRRGVNPLDRSKYILSVRNAL